MKYALLSDINALDEHDSLVVGLCANKLEPANGLPKAIETAVLAAQKRGDASSKPGHQFVLSMSGAGKPGRVIICGCGDKAKNYDLAVRDRALGLAAQVALGLGNKRLVLALAASNPGSDDASTALRRGIQAAGHACYRFDECRSTKPPRQHLKALAFPVPADMDKKQAQSILKQASSVVAGMDLARDLGNRPGNLCTPTDLASCAENMAAEFGKLSCRVLGEAEMADLGMGALLSVSRGSREEAKLIALQWTGGKKSDKTVALVGKGLTFDAGGISLKPAAKMEEMKFDMMGGGAVLGTMRAVAEMELPINLLAVVVASENLPDGAANKPGDVVTSLSGQTIEVVNTDAEGRLILCDALTWVQREYKPDTIVDMATLTGACVVALGEHACALYANDDSLAEELQAASGQSGDRSWRMPLWEDYQKQLDSPVADMQNVGGPGGGSITAACFLHRFTRDARWAHLDIAGVAWSNKKLATGRPVTLLAQWLINQAG